MNVFDKAQRVELNSLEILLPFLRMNCYKGQFVVTSKGQSSKFLQRTVGDFLVNKSETEVVAIELKTEKKETGNLFLEVWSNRDFDRRKHGWMHTLMADVLWYYFIDTDNLYVLNFRELWRWAFVERNIERYREVEQKSYNQLNKTYGRIVPIKDIEKAIKVKTYNPKSDLHRLELEDEKKEGKLITLPNSQKNLLKGAQGQALPDK